MYDLKSINIKELEQISFLFPGDLYALAFFVKRVDIERSKEESAKNPEKNAEWLPKYGKFLKIAGPCLVVIGILTLVMSKFVDV